MHSWWDLGEGSGHLGSELALWRVECAFCTESGNFELEHHAEKRKPNGPKVLNFDTYRCGNCAGYVMVLWSGSGDHISGQGLHAHHVLPWRIGVRSPSANWPTTVQKFWSQAHNSLLNAQLDAAVVMARSALQAAMRDKGANGKDLYNEILSLVESHDLPKILGEWAHEVRLAARPSAHPSEADEDLQSSDAEDMVRFLDFLLEYLYDVPKQIQEFRDRRKLEGERAK